MHEGVKIYLDTTLVPITVEEEEEAGSVKPKLPEHCYFF